MSSEGSIYGISPKEVEELWAAMRNHYSGLTINDRRALYSTLASMGTGCSWDQVAMMQPLWIDLLRQEDPKVCAVSERQLRRDFNHIGEMFVNNPMMHASIRFSHMHPLMPGVTAILDGTVIPVRWRDTIAETRDGVTANVDRNYSGKHQTICLKFEVWCTLDGIPFFVRGPVAGRVHDGHLFAHPPWWNETKEVLFKHRPDEYVLGDSGYQGKDHCLVPYKKRSGASLSDNEKWFNKRHRLWRSRVERLFSFFDRFRFLQYTEHQEAWLRQALHIVCNIFYLKYSAQPQYADCDCKLVGFTELKQECLCSRGSGVAPRGDSKRQELLSLWQEHDMPYEPRPPSKGRVTPQ